MWWIWGSIGYQIHRISRIHRVNPLLGRLPVLLILQ